jgi:FlaA1/EpsC-like NDP-sugar epimerase
MPDSPFFLSRKVLKHRLPVIVLLHLLLIPASNYFSFWLRFDGEIPKQFLNLMWNMLPVLMLIRACVFFTHRLYNGLWRYTGIWDLWRIISATLIGSFIFYAVTHWALDLRAYPRSVFVIDSILQIFFLAGVRMPSRIFREIRRTSKKEKRVIIYGAGDAGEMIVRDMRVHPEYSYNPVGFVDDDRRKVGQQIHGVPVLGTRDMLSKIIRERSIEEVIVAIPSAEPPTLREVLNQLEPFNIPIKTTPNFRDILDGTVTVSQIRNLAVEDLLTRVPVNLDLTSVFKMLEGKKVLVTGAGGSIGAELCRQILKVNVQSLLLVERYENGLFEIVNELQRLGYGDKIVPLIGDITDRLRIHAIFQEYRPDVVFHAAAHKHVPLMEGNACEAIKNNVTGTRRLAVAACRYGVERFVLISTDKAVNPTSVMGASKRVAELIISALSRRNKTTFVGVRFGNVLNSKGSVIPIFQEQIRRGGPVTVTHPEMKRYFMLIPEAVQLVLIAGAMAKSANIYVLQMGEQIKLVEMARTLIRLSGYIPDVEIPIVFTQVRAGEKLYEELVGSDEQATPSEIPEILSLRHRRNMNSGTLKTFIHKLEQASRSNDQEMVIALLKELISTFRPDEMVLEMSQPVIQKPLRVS